MSIFENCKYRNKNACCPEWLGGNCNEECIRIHMTNEPLLIFEHGSTVYGTNNENSDMDLVIVVPDKYFDFLKNYPNCTYQFNPREFGSNINGYRNYGYYMPDFEYITESTYIELIKNFNIMAIESLFLSRKNIVQGKPSKYLCYANLNDKWGIRQAFSGTASNSWAKAHKKMTVEKDFDMYTGQKSLFHSLRILDFANQICENGKIIDYSSMNSYWKDIYNENEPSWEKYKEKYKSVYNNLRSKLAELAPKPIENNK